MDKFLYDHFDKNILIELSIEEIKSKINLLIVNEKDTKLISDHFEQFKKDLEF